MLAYLTFLLAATGSGGAEKTAAQATDQPVKWTELKKSLPPIQSRAPIPKGNPGSWVNSNDYPSQALRSETEGLTGFQLTIGTDGKVSNCHVTQSSGDATLDLATCTIVTRRARFQPALDDAGKPTIGTYRNRVRWQIPVDPSYTFQIENLITSPQLLGSHNIDLVSQYPASARALRQGGVVIIAVDVSDIGRVRACTVTHSSGFVALDVQSCMIAKRWSNYTPAYNDAGMPIRGRAKHQFIWIAPKVYDAYGQLLPLAVPPDKLQ
jgi:TonB family protein